MADSESNSAKYSRAFSITLGASQTDEINVGIAINANERSMTAIAVFTGITAKTTTKKMMIH